MLASVYSYRVIVKSVSSCCVRGRRVLSDPVTFIPILSINTAKLAQIECRWIHIYTV